MQPGKEKREPGEEVMSIQGTEVVGRGLSQPGATTPQSQRTERSRCDKMRGSSGREKSLREGSANYGPPPAFVNKVLLGCDRYAHVCIHTSLQN